MKTATKLNNKYMLIEFSADTKQEFQNILKVVRTLPGRDYNKKSKQWTAPITMLSVKTLQKINFDIDPRMISSRSKKQSVKKDISHLLENSGARPFQSNGVQMIENLNGRALLADEMGLGKTIQALLYIKINPDIRPVIITMPGSLKLNWRDEANKWLNKKDKILTVFGQKKLDNYDADIIIINYDILSYHVAKLLKLKAKLFITDECHYINNEKTQRTIASKTLAKKVKKFLALSGTPIKGKPVQFFTTLNLLRPDLFPSHWNFAERYCGIKHNGFGWDYSGASNIPELHRLLKEQVMIRRLKCNVLKELPDKQKIIIPLEINNRKEYNEAARNITKWIIKNIGKEAAKSRKKAEALTKVETLKQIAAQGKLKQAIEWIENFLESGEKLVLFCLHRSILDELYNHFKSISVCMHGGTKDKQAIVKSFQTDEKIKLIIGQMNSIKEGHTLTAASNTCHVELAPNPSDDDQMDDRAHRIGQDNAVNCYYLVAENTVEDKIMKTIDQRRVVVDAVIDGKETDAEDLYYDNLIEYLKELEK